MTETEVNWFTVTGEVVKFLNDDEIMVIWPRWVADQWVNDGRLYLRWVGHDFTNQSNPDGDFTEVGHTVRFDTNVKEQHDYLKSL